MTDHDLDAVVEIRGGAGPEEAAAITAVISHLLDAEAATVANPSTRPERSAWVVAGLPRHVPAPLPSHTYSAVAWSDAEDAAPPE